MNVSTKSPNQADRRIAQRMRLQRLNLGMSQEALGQALGITFQQIQKYEKGLNRVSASRLEEIARVLEVPVAYFYDDGVDTPQPSPLLPDTPQSVSLLQAFTAIAHSALQQRTLALVRAISKLKAEQGR
jgi:transcriptional regulator with XRE-family HTH domain